MFLRRDWADLATLRRLFAHPRAQAHVDVRRSAEERERIYGPDMMAAEWARREQLNVPEGSTIAPVGLYDDKTHASRAGRHAFHPVHAFLGNLPAEVLGTQEGYEMVAMLQVMRKQKPGEKDNEYRCGDGGVWPRGEPRHGATKQSHESLRGCPDRPALLYVTLCRQRRMEHYHLQMVEITKELVTPGKV